MLSHFSHVQPFATPWTVACQAPLSMGFSRQEYWNGLPCLLPGDLSDPVIKPTSLMFPALAGEFFITSAIWEALNPPVESLYFQGNWGPCFMNSLCFLGFQCSSSTSVPPVLETPVILKLLIGTSHLSSWGTLWPHITTVRYTLDFSFLL